MSSSRISWKELYIGYFNRAPDPVGFTFWENALANGFTILEAAQDFAGQAETLTEYPFLADPTSSDLQTFLGTVYDNLFGRVPDQAGLDFWVDQIEGGLPVGTAILDIIEGAAPEDQAALENKIEIACRWFDLAVTEPDFALTSEAIASSRTALDLVTSDPDTAAEDSAAAATVDAFFNDAPALAVTSVVTSLPEDADTTSRTKLSEVVVIDDTLGQNVLSLSGADAAFFEIESQSVETFVSTGAQASVIEIERAEVFLRAGVALDFETVSNLNVQVDLTDATLTGAQQSSQPLSLSITDVNESPSLSVVPVLSVLSSGLDTGVRIKVGDIVVLDDALGSAVLSLSGADAGLFEIDGSELFLVAGAVLDPAVDAVLDVVVEVDDPALGAGIEASVPLSFTVDDSNTTPSVSLGNVIASLGEDADTTSRIKVADIVVTDDGVGTNALALSGDDAGLFEIDGSELFVRAGAALDFETNPVLDVTVSVDDAAVPGSPDGSADLSLALTDANEAPTLSTILAGVALSEDTSTAARIKVADISIVDDALGNVSAVLLGDDAGLFEIDGDELFLRAGVTLDFATNPSLDVTISVDDPDIGTGPEATEDLSFALGDANDAPVLDGLNQIVTALDEAADTAVRIKVADVLITDDGQGNNVLSLSGDDAGLFEIDGTEVFLVAGAALDFETNPSLDVTVTLDDPDVGATPDGTADLSIAVVDANDAPGLSVMVTNSDIAEDTDTTSPVKVGDILISDDALGTADITLSGDDAALFEVVGTELFLVAGAVLDFETDPVLNVTVNVDDAAVGGSPDASVDVIFNVTDVNDAPGLSVTATSTDISEDVDTTNPVKVGDILISDDALGTADITLSGDDAALFEVIGDEIFLRAGVTLDFETNPVLDITVNVDDPAVGSSPDASVDLTFGVIDVNEPPSGLSVGVTSTSLAEDTDTTTPIKIGDIAISDDAQGTADITLSGDDAALFEVVGTELFLRAGVTLDFETNPVLDVIVNVDDPAVGGTPDASVPVSVQITDVPEAPVVGDDVLTDGEMRVNSILGLDQEQAAITTLSNGRVVVLWRSEAPEQGDTSGSGIKGRILDSSGNEVVSEFLVNSGTANDQDLPAVTALAGGGFVATWQSDTGTDTDIVGRIFDASGTAAGTDITLNTQGAGDQAMPALSALPGGGFVAVWESDTPGQGDASGSGIKARVFDATGTQVEAESLINSLTTGDQGAPDIATLNNGSLVAVWTADAPSDADTNGTAVKARIIQPDGTQVTAEFLVNAETFGVQQNAVVTPLASGGFLVSWESNDGQGSDTSSFAVKGRIFDATGTPVSGEFQVNTATAGFQNAPEITALNDGSFVAVWTSQFIGQTTGPTDIQAQLYNADGTPKGTEFRVNDETDNRQSEPVVTALPTGGFAVAWTSEDQSSGDGSGSAIKATYFDADGNLLGAPLVVTENETATVNVSALLANDLDPDGDPLTLTSIAGGATGGTSTAGATITLNGDGTFTYDPTGVAAFDALTPGQFATDTFTYTVTDASGLTGTATVSITVEGVNDTPQIDLNATLTSILDTTPTTTRIKVADIVITDDNSGTNILSLAGQDSTLFEIDGTELFIAAGATLDVATNPSLDVTVNIDDISTPVSVDDSASLSVLVTTNNIPPVLFLNNVIADLNDALDTTTRVKVADILLLDDGTGTNTLTVTGPDAALFEVDGLEVFIRAGAALDFETNPVLDFTVEVDDPAVGTTPDSSATDSIDVTLGVFDLTNAENGDGGFVINGAATDDRSGLSVSSAGDVNGDGLEDVIVGARFADPASTTNAGTSYVVFGRTDVATVELSSLAATEGFVINGAAV
jgi:VCBS repeat-containing protein